MPENTGETVEPQQPATGDNTETTNGDDTALGEAGRKALAAEREARKVAEKALREAQGQIRAFETENVSDLEKAQAAAKEWQERAQAAMVETLRYRIATEHGITVEDAETFLTATDEDGLKKQAERLKALATKSGTPAPDPTQGARGDQPKLSTAQRFAEAFAGRI